MTQDNKILIVQFVAMMLGFGAGIMAGLGIVNIFFN